MNRKILTHIIYIIVIMVLIGAHLFRNNDVKNLKNLKKDYDSIAVNLRNIENEYSSLSKEYDYVITSQQENVVLSDSLLNVLDSTNKESKRRITSLNAQIDSIIGKYGSNDELMDKKVFKSIQDNVN